MSKVYIVQEPLRRNKKTGQLEACMDLSPASVYGDLVFLLERGNVTLTPAPMIHSLRKKLKDYTDDDYLLPVGDTVAMTAAAMVASEQNNGRVNLLKWNRETRSYIKVSIEL